MKYLITLFLFLIGLAYFYPYLFPFDPTEDCTEWLGIPLEAVPPACVDYWSKK